MKVEIYEGRDAWGVVEVMGGDHLLLTDAAAQSLQQQKFQGYQLERYVVAKTIKGKLTEVDNPRLWHVQTLGKSILRKPILEGAPDVCPFCGHAPHICPGCGDRIWQCPRCGKNREAPEREHKGAGDKRFIIQKPEDRPEDIVEASQWDGSDFVGFGIVTRRVIDWLLSIHAAPFHARPLYVNVEGIDKAKWELLERAKKLVATPPASK